MAVISPDFDEVRVTANCRDADFGLPTVRAIIVTIDQVTKIRRRTAAIIDSKNSIEAATGGAYSNITRVLRSIAEPEVRSSYTNVGAVERSTTGIESQI